MSDYELKNEEVRFYAVTGRLEAEYGAAGVAKMSSEEPDRFAEIKNRYESEFNEWLESREEEALYEGLAWERKRVEIELELEMRCDCKDAMQHMKKRISGGNK